MAALVRASVWTGLIRVAGFVVAFGEIFPGNNKLYQAIDRGDAAEVRLLVRQKVAGK